MMLPLTPVGPLLEQWVVNALVTLCIGGAIQLGYVVGDRFLPGWALHLVAVVGGTLLGTEVASWLIHLGWGLDVPTVRDSVLRLGLILGVVVTAVAVLVAQLRQRIYAAELREELARRAALAAKLQAIQARTQPHFLFNSLNVVAALIEEDPPRAAVVLDHLTGLFRFAVDVGDQRTVPLGEELGAVADYLTVEATRFADRLTWALRWDEGLAEVPVPPFVVQPLVENAVKHGIGSRPGAGHVSVEVVVGDRHLAMIVEDDGVGLGGSVHAGSGTALADLEERLALLYGTDAGLEVSARPGGGTRVQVRIPREAP